MKPEYSNINRCLFLLQNPQFANAYVSSILVLCALYTCVSFIGLRAHQGIVCATAIQLNIIVLLTLGFDIHAYNRAKLIKCMAMQPNMNLLYLEKINDIPHHSSRVAIQ